MPGTSKDLFNAAPAMYEALRATRDASERAVQIARLEDPAARADSMDELGELYYRAAVLRDSALAKAEGRES